MGTPSMTSGDISTILTQFSSSDLAPNHYLLMVKNSPQIAQELTGDEAQNFMDGVDHALDSNSLQTDSFRSCLNALRRVCGRTGRLPKSYMLDFEPGSPRDKIPDANGGTADIWREIYNGDFVALKELRISEQDNPDEIKKKFCKEAVMWKHISHPNIVPFLGVKSIVPPSMVSRWMVNGNILDYIRTNSNINRLRLLRGICKGVKHLHSNCVAHGDLKSRNILVDCEGHPRLVDFGITSVISNLNAVNATSVSSRPHGTCRWMAPELLVPEVFGLEVSTPSYKGDVFALAMVIIELFTGEYPFPTSPDTAVTYKVMNDIRPPRPTNGAALGLSDEIWALVERCWHREASQRPLIDEVLNRLPKNS